MLLPKFIRPDNHPFSLSLYVEWALLGFALSNEFIPAPVPTEQRHYIITISSILLFSILGLRLPTQPLSLKLSHEALQISLVWFAASFSIFKLRLLVLLLIVIILRTCLIFRWQGRLVVAIISFLSFNFMAKIQLDIFSRQFPPTLAEKLIPKITLVRLNLSFLFFLLLVFLLWLINALLTERQQHLQLRVANQKLLELTTQIEELAMAKERTRIAQEIHDALGHALTGLNIQLESALKLWEIDHQESRKLVSQAKTMGSMALQEAREAVTTLREVPLGQEQDLLTTISPLLQQFEQMTGIIPRVINNSPPLPTALSLIIYRILQEALTNICKHANAEQVEIAINIKAENLPFQKSNKHYLKLIIKDNGVGFHPENNTTGFGLQGIQERAMASGGKAKWQSTPGNGCIVQIFFPLPMEVEV